jgi:hypothetical protein
LPFEDLKYALSGFFLSLLRLSSSFGFSFSFGFLGTISITGGLGFGFGFLSPSFCAEAVIEKQIITAIANNNCFNTFISGVSFPFKSYAPEGERKLCAAFYKSKNDAINFILPVLLHFGSKRVPLLFDSFTKLYVFRNFYTK